MSLGDFQVLESGAFGDIGSHEFQVAAGGSGKTIQPGEPVVRTLGSQYVALAATNSPVVGTQYVVGFAATQSTETAAVDGKVQVTPLVPGMIYIGNPTVAATWNTQAKYNALVGTRVLWDLTTGVFTVLAADNSTYGLVVEQLTLTTPTSNKVAFSIREGASYLA